MGWKSQKIRRKYGEKRKRSDGRPVKAGDRKEELIPYYNDGLYGRLGDKFLARLKAKGQKLCMSLFMMTPPLTPAPSIC